MHACIAAFSAGTPVLPVAYSRKFSGLFGLLGYDHVLPLTGMTEEAATRFVLGALDRRVELSRTQAVAMERVEGLLDVYRGTLTNVFADALGRRGVTSSR